MAATQAKVTEEDPLGPARGILLGLAVAGVLWGGAGIGVWQFVKWTLLLAARRG